MKPKSPEKGKPEEKDPEKSPTKKQEGKWAAWGAVGTEPASPGATQPLGLSHPGAAPGLGAQRRQASGSKGAGKRARLPREMLSP